MKISRKKLISALLLFLVILCFLINAKGTSEYAFIGLNAWYQNMIKSLFPFMVLLNLLIQSDLATYFIKPVSLLLKPVFRICDEAVFVIFFGFLCGFPLGAKCITDLYKKNKISLSCAEYLLCFTNNIGPAYFLGFVLQSVYVTDSIGKSLFYMYGIPLFYGLILRYTLYKKALDHEYSSPFKNRKELVAAEMSKQLKTSDTTNSNEVKNTAFLSSREKSGNVLAHLPDAIQNSLIQIAILGGYMIIFNAIRIIPSILFDHVPALYLLSHSILEITGGLLCLKAAFKNSFFLLLTCHAALSFGGLCCYFQTVSLLDKTPLSGQKYMLHKIILCSITVFTILVLH